jgi:hypothetical protein
LAKPRCKLAYSAVLGELGQTQPLASRVRLWCEALRCMKDKSHAVMAAVSKKGVLRLPETASAWTCINI